jgi:hypothetical protein
MEQGVSIKFCAELEKKGTDWWADVVIIVATGFRISSSV